MTLTDTGPLVGLVDADDQHHVICVAGLAELPAEPLLTTWPCLAEAMYMLGRRGGYRYQAALWDMYCDGRLILHQLSSVATARMAALMEQYRDMPMDLADASLVAASETLGTRMVSTIDRQFCVYRLENGAAMDVVP